MKLVLKSFQYVLVLFFYHFSSFLFESIACIFTRMKKKTNQDTVQSDTISRGKKKTDIVNKKREQSNLLFLAFVFITQNVTFINTNTLNSLGLQNKLHKR